MQTQQKNILKTVLIIVAVMLLILVLFINKITTPRYLSNIELKINGFIILDPPISVSIDTENWQLLASTPEQYQFVEKVIPQLNTGIRKQTQLQLVENNQEIEAALANIQEGIALISGQQLRGYFKPPFDEHKFLLTYSSVVTHR